VTRLSRGDDVDIITAGDGHDRRADGLDGDRLTGGDGNDLINGGDGRNRYSGGARRDVIDATNGSVETINCGAGRDTVRAASSDRMIGCERVFRLRPNNP
jgi:Ca2+-binding RTX toxin-like protein